MEKDFAKAIRYTAKILDLWLPLKLQYDMILGLSVGIVYKGKLVYQKGFGYADTEAKVRATPKTGYRIASISKTFTSIVIMQLVEGGKLKLNDRAVKYLPWFKARNGRLDLSGITIRQLLSHTAGVFRDGDTPHWEDDRFPDTKALQKSISDKTPVLKNPSHFKYSNFAFAILGEIIHQRTGLSYDEYVTKHIIRRLGLNNTYPDFTRRTGSRLAKGYSRFVPNEKREVFKHVPTRAYASAAGFISNVSDLAKYLTALSSGRKGGNTLISPRSKKIIMKKYKETGGKRESYGLGFVVYKIEGRELVGHGGGFSGFTTRVALDTENDIGVITLSNSNGSTAPVINDGILSTIYQLVDKEVKYTGDRKIKSQEKYEGVYRSRCGDQVVAGVGANLIAFDPRTNSPIGEGNLLKPEGRDCFLIKAKSNFDSTGELARFILDARSKKARQLICGSHPYKRLNLF